MNKEYFEWNEEKREKNIEKHGIDFEDAKFIFSGPTLEREDKRFAYGEKRMIALGEVDGYVIVVVYTPRNEAKRIISARKASRDERIAYNKAVLGSAQDDGPD